MRGRAMGRGGCHGGRNLPLAGHRPEWLAPGLAETGSGDTLGLRRDLLFGLHYRRFCQETISEGRFEVGNEIVQLPRLMLRLAFALLRTSAG